MSIRLGYHIPYFHHTETVTDLFPALVAQVRAAEDSGFDLVTTMDHFYQPPLIGPPDGPMLEAYTLLGALAAATSRVQLSTMVTGIGYRNPALLAKMVTTLDVISQGRAVLGVGAGWHEQEHREYGYEFGTVAERFGRFEEALAIAVPMLRGARPRVEGRWFRAEGAINEPRLRENLPLLIGGGGEKKTFAFAARHADHLNIICTSSELPQKMAAVRARCAEADRDPATLETSFAMPLIIDEDGDRARKLLDEALLRSGVNVAELTDSERAAATDRFFVGTPAEVTEQLQERVLCHGVGGLMANMLANAHDPDSITLAGRTLAPLVGLAPKAGTTT
ncbi:LLM class F420-dependent oxidoreductase [Streptomyces sp. NPDC058766]|uniref:LLM class F420-dependent oxidoreductase n=1 Tax=Streptomyces sp. NPDC058766 TaxID=3346630 RepID=UPI0036B9ACC9